MNRYENNQETDQIFYLKTCVEHVLNTCFQHMFNTGKVVHSFYRKSWSQKHVLNTCFEHVFCLKVRC